MEEAEHIMELTVGAVLEGKIKTITNFGAFVSLPENKTGMVHISEVANAYVSDIREHLTEGQDVKVMVIGTENGKINLSIKRLEPRRQFPAQRGRRLPASGRRQLPAPGWRRLPASGRWQFPAPGQPSPAHSRSARRSQNCRPAV